MVLCPLGCRSPGASFPRVRRQGQARAMYGRTGCSPTHSLAQSCCHIRAQCCPCELEGRARGHCQAAAVLPQAGRDEMGTCTWPKLDSSSCRQPLLPLFPQNYTCLLQSIYLYKFNIKTTHGCQYGPVGHSFSTCAPGSWGQESPVPAQLLPSLSYRRRNMQLLPRT